MTKPMRNLKFALICAAGAATITACSPRHHMSSQYGADQYAYGHHNTSQHGSEYSSEYYAADYHAAGQHTQLRSRYGSAAHSTSLNAGCDEYVNPCGFMKVVPVYPIYQIAAPVQEAYAEPYVAPLEEAPIVVMPEPELPVYVEPTLPDPIPYVAEPQHWPEPETPVTSWAPLRK